MGKTLEQKVQEVNQSVEQAKAVLHQLIGRKSILEELLKEKQSSDCEKPKTENIKIEAPNSSKDVDTSEKKQDGKTE